MRSGTGYLLKAAVASLCLGGLMVSQPVRAEEGTFMKDILGNIGIIDKERPAIRYRERAPLVLPPKSELPKPLEPGSVGARNAAWPSDPDVLAAREAEEEARKPSPVLNDKMVSQGGRLSIDEIRAGRRPGGGMASSSEPPKHYGDHSREETWVHPDQLRAQGVKTNEPLIAYGKEPERRVLSDPPSGLRLPAASAKLPETSAEPVLTEKDDSDQRGFARRGY